MNLEKIKNNQREINQRLTAHLEDSSRLLDYIAGESPEMSDDSEQPIPSGLLEEIAFQQHITETAINKLYRNHQRMAEHVYNEDVKTSAGSIKVY